MEDVSWPEIVLSGRLSSFIMQRIIMRRMLNCAIAVRCPVLLRDPLSHGEMSEASECSERTLTLATHPVLPAVSPQRPVHRPRLNDQLNCSSDRPLTLVTAPAGYGKSILVSAWLSICERPSAWLSLDETVDDLGAFLAHFVAAIRTIFPDALRQTQTLLTAISLPPLGVLAGSLVNELDELNTTSSWFWMTITRSTGRKSTT